MDFRILLYYKFVPLSDPEAVAETQRTLCRKLGLKGRILVASEGINGTVSGPIESTDKYIEATRAMPEFADMEFKIDESEGHAFPKMVVKVRPEIVTLGVPVQDPSLTGHFLEPAEWKEMMARPDALILDIRNGYEYEIGHFAGAVRADVETFKEFPAWLEKTLEGAEDRPILTYCTGGIRCEKATAYLREKGVQNVYQLHGGIVTYGKDPVVQGDGWEGECFVFDERLSVPINPKAKPVSMCRHCGTPTSRQQNCAAVDCNLLFACCEGCSGTFSVCCKAECEAQARRREARAKLAPELRSERAKLRRQAHRAAKKARLAEAAGS